MPVEFRPERLSNSSEKHHYRLSHCLLFCTEGSHIPEHRDENRSLKHNINDSSCAYVCLLPSVLIRVVDSVEVGVQTRPLMSVPHLLFRISCYQ